jgi:hypothetical protein
LSETGSIETSSSVNVAKREDIVIAQSIIAADIVISPDRIDDVEFTRNNLEWCLEQFNLRTAAVIVGDDEGDRMGLLELYRMMYVPTICFPYRRDRQAWIAEFDIHHKGWDLGKQVHFLGMQDLSEARRAATRFPKGTFDTSKPLKWGYKVERLDNVTTTHGAWPHYDSFLDAPEMELDQMATALYNVACLRRFLA